MDINKVYSEWRWYADEIRNYDVSYTNEYAREDFNEFLTEFYTTDHTITKEEMATLEQNFVPMTREEIMVIEV